MFVCVCVYCLPADRSRGAPRLVPPSTGPACHLALPSTAATVVFRRLSRIVNPAIVHFQRLATQLFVPSQASHPPIKMFVLNFGCSPEFPSIELPVAVYSTLTPWESIGESRKVVFVCLFFCPPEHGTGQRLEAVSLKFAMRAQRHIPGPLVRPVTGQKQERERE